jgi:hypothetical protein
MSREPTLAATSSGNLSESLLHATSSDEMHRTIETVFIKRNTAMLLIGNFAKPRLVIDA